MHIPCSCLQGKAKTIWTLYFPVGSLTFENSIVQIESACLAGKWYFTWPQKVTSSKFAEVHSMEQCCAYCKTHIRQPAIKGSILENIYFSCASLGGMVEKWRHNWSSWRSEFLYYYWSQPHHQAGPPLRYCKLYLCRQKHCCQEKKYNSNCHSLWWVSFWGLSLFSSCQTVVSLFNFKIPNKRSPFNPHCFSLPASHMDGEVSLLLYYS